ncbi:hypothetical protein AAFF_G00084830 [Aldrovandia affinis]|uniref:Uncharacterized protein n=1 Tax=Aldrovandia affinis TaxID=143900 RepID=A0AAD7RX47_9TELE|nr:hypothetical protein AAFF_G00084830 [Aldrovandia affinis]
MEGAKAAASKGLEEQFCVWRHCGKTTVQTRVTAQSESQSERHEARGQLYGESVGTGCWSCRGLFPNGARGQAETPLESYSVCKFSTMWPH